MNEITDGDIGLTQQRMGVVNIRGSACFRIFQALRIAKL